MISDYDLFVNKYISVPKDLGQLNCAAFVAGIVKGCLDGAGFPARQAIRLVSCSLLQLQASAISTCRVTAHFVPVPGQTKPKTTILMKFEESVIQRNKTAHP